MSTVAVLFARADSVYKGMHDVDVWDIERDARCYDGPHPVVAHPPCRGWGRLRHMANPRPDERNLARLAVALVREFGGVLEHPSHSTLWTAQRLPRPGCSDSYGWTLPISQHWWGHKAEKSTWLYIVGVRAGDIPEMPLALGEAMKVIGQARQARPDLGRGRLKKGMAGWRPEVTPREREATPPALAAWLVDLARRCEVRQ